MKYKETVQGDLGRKGNTATTGGGFLKSVITLTGGTILGQGIIVLASPIITRLYDPADLGILAVYSSILGIFTVIASMRYETVIPLPEKDEDAANIIGLALCIVLAVSLLAGGVSLAFGKQITGSINAPALRPYLWLLPLGVAMIGTYQVFASWAVRKQAYNLVARTKINQGLGSVFAQIGLGMLRIRPLGLLIGQVIGLASGVLTLVALFLKKDRGVLKAINPRQMRMVAGRYKKFPAIGAPAAALNSITVYIPAILLAALYGPQVAGWFAVTQRAVGMPLNMIGQSVAQVYFGKAAPLARLSPMEFGKFSYSLLLRLIILSMVIITPIILIAPRLFVYIFGANWAEAGSYLPRLAPLFITQFISLPFGCALDILEKQGLFFLRETIRITLILGAFIFISISGMPARNAMAILGIAGSIGYAFYIVIAFHAIKKNR